MYTSRKKYSSITMYREDFIELEKIIRKNVKLNKKYRDSIKIRAINSEMDVSKNKIESFEVDTIKNIKSLWVTAKGWENDEIVESIDITFSSNYTELYIKGNDEIWTKGIQSKIENFLNSKKTFSNKYIPIMQTILSIAIGALTPGFIAAIIISYMNTDVLNIILSVIGFISLSFLFYFNLKGLSKYYNVISLDLRKESKFFISFSDWISIIGLAIGIISIILTAIGLFLS